MSMKIFLLIASLWNLLVYSYCIFIGLKYEHFEILHFVVKSRILWNLVWMWNKLCQVWVMNKASWREEVEGIEISTIFTSPPQKTIFCFEWPLFCYVISKRSPTKYKFQATYLVWVLRIFCEEIQSRTQDVQNFYLHFVFLLAIKRNFTGL